MPHPVPPAALPALDYIGALDAVTVLSRACGRTP